MAAPTAALSANQPGPAPGPNGLLSEDWDITGDTSVDGDTVAIVSRFFARPQRVEGAVSWAISGQTVTCKLMAALAASEVITVRIFGFP
jgi:hypothetical protein